MKLNYHVVDVFTNTRFGGNPLAVVLDADELTTQQMQTVAREFNFSETSFVLTPKDKNNTAHVRIFTPNSEMDFAGHPNVGTSYVLANLASGAPQKLVFEERVGLVEVDVTYSENGDVQTTAITSPMPLSKGAEYNPMDAARALSLELEDVLTTHHAPQHVSVGANFVVVELASRKALKDLRLNEYAARAMVGEGPAKAIYAYTRDVEGRLDWSARMYTFRGAPYEDPATGSAGGAMAAFAHDLGVKPINGSYYTVTQGVDMGRPSAMQLKMHKGDSGAIVEIAGSSVDVMRGVLEV
ncbi:MAG: PhzF family phenazine biosynthesis protein [Lentilitoribacter sp.]